MNYEEICKAVIALTKKTGAYIAAERALFSKENIEVKGKANFVTHVDKTAEQQLVDGLSLILPEAGFIAEEGTSEKRGKHFNWVVDPLDGTTNFIHGTPPYAISIALMKNDKVVAGVVYEITLNECFYAWEGSPAYLNGKEISVSDASTTKDALVATGFPYYDFSQLDNYIELMKYIMHHSHGIRRLGSAATDLAYVAAGRYDAFWEYGLNAWDVAAGTFILQQAGGRITDFNGNDNFIFGKEIVAANAAYFPEFHEIVYKFLGS